MRKLTAIDLLADLLADGYDVPTAATMLGITRAYANSLVQRMRARLGWQAV